MHDQTLLSARCTELWKLVLLLAWHIAVVYDIFIRAARPQSMHVWEVHLFAVVGNSIRSELISQYLKGFRLVRTHWGRVWILGILCMFGVCNRGDWNYAFFHTYYMDEPQMHGWYLYFVVGGSFSIYFFQRNSDTWSERRRRGRASCSSSTCSSTQNSTAVLSTSCWKASSKPSSPTTNSRKHSASSIPSRPGWRSRTRRTSPPLPPPRATPRALRGSEATDRKRRRRRKISGFLLRFSFSFSRCSRRWWICECCDLLWDRIG